MKQVIGFTVCVFAALVCWACYALFHGYFDQSSFHIEQVQWSEQKKVAVIVKHSDHQALNGDEYFLLIGDHDFTTGEARRAYYNHQAIFGTDENCLVIRWLDASDLSLACSSHSIGPDQIDVKKDHADGVRIVYKGIGPE